MAETNVSIIRQNQSDVVLQFLIAKGWIQHINFKDYWTIVEVSKECCINGPKVNEQLLIQIDETMNGLLKKNSSNDLQQTDYAREKVINELKKTIPFIYETTK